MKLSPGSIQARLVLLTLAALVPAFLVIIFNDYRLSAARRVEVQELALRSALQSTAEIERLTDSIKSLFAAISLVSEIRNGEREACSRYLSDLLPSTPFLKSIRVMDAEATTACASSGAVNETPFDAAFVKQALNTSDIILGVYSVGPDAGKPVLPIAMATSQRVAAKPVVVAAELDLSWLGDQLRNRMPPGGSLTIADRNGVILSRNPLPERFLGTKIPDEFMRLVTAASPGSIEVLSQDGTPRILGYVPITVPPIGLYVSAGLSEEASFHALTRSNRISALIAAFGAILALLSSWIAGKLIFTKPLSIITRTMDRWRSGDESARTGFRNEDSEIEGLGVQLDRTMDEFIEQKNRNAVLSQELAHRVKNTLAIIQAIARFTFAKPERGKEALDDFTSRIQAMGKAHEVLMREQWSSAPLMAVMREALQPLVRDFTQIECDGPELTLGPKHALAMTMVLHELCTNAMKYGALSTPEGRVSIRWTAEPTDDAVVLLWREQGGPPVSPPAHLGFGSTLIKRGFGSEFDGVTLSYPPEGATCEIRWRMSAAAH
ncbi:MAG: hypothetical protein K2P80_06070 [Beijerinckiaceae bacterium]|nr:hypothetical protein [Beijerinckiaceae bacterium]